MYALYAWICAGSAYFSRKVWPDRDPVLVKLHLRRLPSCCSASLKKRAILSTGSSRSLSAFTFPPSRRKSSTCCCLESFYLKVSSPIGPWRSESSRSGCSFSTLTSFERSSVSCWNRFPRCCRVFRSIRSAGRHSKFSLSFST